MDLEKYYDEYWRNKPDDVDEIRIGLVIEKVRPRENVLEVGGHVGMLAERLQKKGADVTVTDISGVALERAGKKGIRGTAKVDLDVEPLPFADNTFDTVVSSSSIEHIFYPEKMVSESARVLKPGGKFILMVPNIAHFRFRFWLLFGRFPYIQNTPTDELHIRFMTLYEAKKMCMRYGLTPESADGSPGLWNRKLYPGLFRKPFIRTVYWALARRFPSLFARDFILACRKAR